MRSARPGLCATQTTLGADVRSTELPEERADVVDEELRLLGRREAAAARHRCPTTDIRMTLCHCTWHWQDIARENCKCAPLPREPPCWSAHCAVYDAISRDDVAMRGASGNLPRLALQRLLQIPVRLKTHPKLRR